MEAMEGQNLYVWQEVEMGVLMARTKRHLVDEEEGRKGVNECQLVDFVYAEEGK